MSEDMQVNETTPEATSAPETDYTAEMSQTFDRLNPPDELAKVSHESELTKYSDDYNVSDEPAEPTEAPQQPIDGVRAPASLSPTMQAQWGATPREMQEWIAQREAQAQQKITEQGERLSELQRGALASMPHREHVERIAQEHGLTPDDTIQRFIAADHFLKTNPVAAIQYLAQAHGVDLGTGNPSQEVEQLRQQYSQQVEQMRNEQAQWHQQREQQEQHLTTAITRFADGKPYWLQQIAAMKAVDPGQVQADPMGALREAEKQALKLTGVDERLPERQAEARKKADDAKRLASLNVRSSSTSPRPIFQSMEDEMRDTFERIHGRH
jgi:hypothetical protein